MSEELEPNAGDILASKLGMDDVHGYLAALHFTLTALLIVLRNKSVIDSNEIDAILEASSAKLADKFDTMAKNAPNFANQSIRMKAAGDVILDVIRHHVATSPQT